MANNTIGEKELKRKWPVVTGLTADAKHEGRQSNLVAEKSYIAKRNLAGIR
jgi:hypothetical protein